MPLFEALASLGNSSANLKADGQDNRVADRADASPLRAPNRGNNKNQRVRPTQK